MVRLTAVRRSRSAISVLVEGRVVAEWGDFLERELVALLRDFQVVRVDLRHVTFIDDKSVGILRRLRSEQIRLTRCPPIIRELLEQEGSP